MRHWPGGKRTAHDGRMVEIAVPQDAELDAELAELLHGPSLLQLDLPLRATVFTTPSKVTLAAQGGAPGTLAALRVVRK